MLFCVVKTDGARIAHCQSDEGKDGAEAIPDPRSPNLKTKKMTQEEIIIKSLDEIRQLTLLSAKSALTMDEVAMLTGLSKSYIYALCCKKQIPHFKSNGGKITYFKKEEVESWMLANRVTTIDEARSKAALLAIGGAK